MQPGEFAATRSIEFGSPWVMEKGRGAELWEDVGKRLGMQLMRLRFQDGECTKQYQTTSSNKQPNPIPLRYGTWLFGSLLTALMLYGGCSVLHPAPHASGVCGMHRLEASAHSH